MNIKKLAITALSTSLLLTVSHGAQAAGFYIQEQSVKGLGTAFAGSTTSIDDASTVYYNPAGMTKLDRMQINAGVDLLIPGGDVDDNGTTSALGAPIGGTTGNPYDPTPVPHLYAVTPLEDYVGLPLWAGIGVTAPFGLGNEYDDDYFGRFDSTESELTTINIAPSIAYKATEWLSIGGGIDIQYADADLKSTVFGGPGTTEGESQLKGDDWSVGYNIGIQANPDFIPNTEFGLHYRSAISHELDGEVNVTGLTAIPDSFRDGTADLDLPDILTFGVAHDVTPKTRVMAQATWFGWNNFQDIDADTNVGIDPAPVEQNYSNTMAFSIGAEHELNETWTVRAGYQFDETPTNDEFRTTRTPDGDRNWFSGGATYTFNNNLDLDFAATYIDIGDETIDVSRNGGQTRAKTDGYVGIVSAGISYKF